MLAINLLSSIKLAIVLAITINWTIMLAILLAIAMNWTIMLAIMKHDCHYVNNYYYMTTVHIISHYFDISNLFNHFFNNSHYLIVSHFVLLLL